MRTRKILATLSLLALPALGGAKGDGCAANSRSPAPDVTGTWDVTYDDTIDVQITIGGAVYTSQIGARGGIINITHNGQPLSFNLDCSRPEVLCPSEAWPATVTAEQRDVGFEHRMYVTLPVQTCSGARVKPAPGTCGTGTDNPSCDDVCTGTVVTTNRETFGVIGENASTFRLYLGGGFVTNGINCALLGWSVADASLATTGSAATADWEATAMNAGAVEVGYAGTCLWAGDTNMDGQLEALLASASIKFTTGFTADRR